MDWGDDPKKTLFYEQVTDGAGTSRGSSNLSNSEVSLRSNEGSSLHDSPQPFPPFGVQVPPKQSKQIREKDVLLNSCPSPQFLWVVGRGSKSSTLTLNLPWSSTLQIPKPHL